MNIISKIRAFFKVQDEEKEMEVFAAEIKQGKVFLHPMENKNIVYALNTDAVDIFINPMESMDINDIEVIEITDKKDKHSSNEPAKKGREEPANGGDHRQDRRTSRRGINRSLYGDKKMIYFSVYPDEHKELMDYIKENGYRKAEYFLACSKAAKKNSMESLYKKYYETHKKRRAEERNFIKNNEKTTYIDNQQEGAI